MCVQCFNDFLSVVRAFNSAKELLLLAHVRHRKPLEIFGLSLSRSCPCEYRCCCIHINDTTKKSLFYYLLLCVILLLILPHCTCPK